MFNVQLAQNNSDCVWVSCSYFRHVEFIGGKYILVTMYNFKLVPEIETLKATKIYIKKSDLQKKNWKKESCDFRSKRCYTFIVTSIEKITTSHNHSLEVV